MMAAHSSLDDVRNWPIFPRLSPVGLAYGLDRRADFSPRNAKHMELIR